MDVHKKPGAMHRVGAFGGRARSRNHRIRRACHVPVIREFNRPQEGTAAEAIQPAFVHLWDLKKPGAGRGSSAFNMSCGIVWLKPYLTKNECHDGHQTNSRQGPFAVRSLVSVLMSIFRPNGLDLVDFRDFRDCASSRVSDWESAK